MAGRQLSVALTVLLIPRSLRRAPHFSASGGRQGDRHGHGRYKCDLKGPSIVCESGKALRNGVTFGATRPRLGALQLSARDKLVVAHRTVRGHIIA